jgi:hypothetical protein
MSQDRAEKRRINRILANHGLPSLEAPNGLMEALGSRITDHEHFRSLLVRCEPNQRTSMYNALKPHLKFSPLPLDVYIARSADLAERKQLPKLDSKGGFIEYRPFEFKTFWSTIIKLSSMSADRLQQAWRYLMRDIPEDKQDQVIYKVHQIVYKPTQEPYLRISAGLYVDGEAMRIQ